jgi:hypothetical protein
MRPVGGAPAHPGGAGEAGGRGTATGGLPVIPGFDLVTVSSWVQHKVERVWNLVEDFVAQEGRTADDLQALLQAQRYDDARLRVHSLMGSAAAVGAKPLAQASAALNMALRAGGEPAPGSAAGAGRGVAHRHRRRHRGAGGAAPLTRRGLHGRGAVSLERVGGATTWAPRRRPAAYVPAPGAGPA